MSYIKNVCVQLISEVRGSFHFQMTGYSRLGGKKAQLFLLHQKKLLLGLGLIYLEEHAQPSTHLLMAMDEIKTITAAVLQKEQGGEPVLCNYMEVQPRT